MRFTQSSGSPNALFRDYLARKAWLMAYVWVDALALEGARRRRGECVDLGHPFMTTE
jgi:hypothetical protein